MQYIILKKLSLITAVFFLLIMTGCIPQSDNPLTDPRKQPIDASLFGTWFWRDNNEIGYLHFGLDQASNLLRVMMIVLKGNGNLEVSEFTGHTSALGHSKYLNLKQVRPVSNITGYIFVKYKVMDNSLGISLPTSEVYEQAIKNGLLNGIIEKGIFRISENPQGLRRFIIKNDKDLFKDMKYLQRVPAHGS